MSNDAVHEAYSFACLRCGHSWEVEYEIRHSINMGGQPVHTYFVNGEQVPSPLRNPQCSTCGGHNVRILSAGRATAARAGQRSLWAGGDTPPASPGHEGRFLD